MLEPSFLGVQSFLAQATLDSLNDPSVHYSYVQNSPSVHSCNVKMTPWSV